MTLGLGDLIALTAAAILALCIVRPRIGNLVALRVTLWSGSLAFLLVHVAVWWAWTRFIEPRPYELLTMALSLESIVLATVTMLGLNLLSKRQNATHATQAQVEEMRRLLIGARTSQARLLKLVRQNDVAMTALDDRLADLQEARHDACH